MKWFQSKKSKQSKDTNDDDHELDHVDLNDDDPKDPDTSNDDDQKGTPRHSQSVSKHRIRQAKKQERKEQKKAKKKKKKNDIPKQNNFNWSRHKVNHSGTTGNVLNQAPQVRTRGLVDPNAGPQDEQNMKFVDDYEAADQDFNKYTQPEYVKMLHFPYIGTKKERENLYKAHVSIVDARRLLMERLVVTLFLAIGFALFTHVIFKKGIVISGLIMIGVGIASWYALSNSINKNYGNFKLNRQIAFNLFEKILTPNLHRVREGDADLTNILEVVSRQIPQEMYRHYVDRLVVDMHMNPGSKEPFDNFARTFSGGENAEIDAMVFTNALYQLTQGNDSIDTINQLLKNSNRQLGQQQDKIMQAKQKPFKVVQYLLFATFFPFTIAYYGTTIMSYISSFHM